ncbi:MAG: aminopeptidase, partial [Myxococcales bacterium]|nr:aminopeptidase [Myxococcales bacterium]
MSRRLWIALVVLAVSLASLTCSPFYVMRAGIEEAKILSRREPIDRLIESPATKEEERRKLALVQQARTFAAEMLGLDVGQSYTTYSWVDRDTLALVLS